MTSFRALEHTLSLIQVDLSENNLCGMRTRGGGTHTLEGVNVIADAIRASSTLTSIE